MENTEPPATMWDILACPTCKGKLKQEKEQLTCAKCGSYAIANRIPVLLAK